jgi:protein-tyrosine phosphatase
MTRFSLKTLWYQEQSLMERRLELEGITNFRDLGGYQTTTGDSVKWRTIFRSDTLSSLSDRDMETVCDLGVNAAFDLRYGDERQLEPSRFLGHDQVEVLEMGLDERPDGKTLDSYERTIVTAEAAKAYMTDSYRNYPFLYAQTYRLMVERVIAGEKVVVHCTAGKDRAGTAAAMMLTILGVPRDTVFEDYMLTNQYWDRAGRERPEMDEQTVANIFSAREDYLSAAFASIESKCGTIDAYLKDVVKLDGSTLAAFRATCLT